MKRVYGVRINGPRLRCAMDRMSIRELGYYSGVGWMTIWRATRSERVMLRSVEKMAKTLKLNPHDLMAQDY